MRSGRSVTASGPHSKHRIRVRPLRERRPYTQPSPRRPEALARALTEPLGARPAIPPKQNEAPVACPEWIYANRNHVERLWARLKEWRAVATRYEKTAQSFMGVLCLAATLDWIKP